MHLTVDKEVKMTHPSQCSEARQGPFWVTIQSPKPARGAIHSFLTSEEFHVVEVFHNVEPTVTSDGLNGLAPSFPTLEVVIPTSRFDCVIQRPTMCGPPYDEVHKRFDFGPDSEFTSCIVLQEHSPSRENSKVKHAVCQIGYHTDLIWGPDLAISVEIGPRVSDRVDHDTVTILYATRFEVDPRTKTLLVVYLEPEADEHFSDELV